MPVLEQMPLLICTGPFPASRGPVCQLECLRDSCGCHQQWPCQGLGVRHEHKTSGEASVILLCTVWSITWYAAPGWLEDSTLTVPVADSAFTSWQSPVSLRFCCLGGEAS